MPTKYFVFGLKDKTPTNNIDNPTNNINKISLEKT